MKKSIKTALLALTCLSMALSACGFGGNGGGTSGGNSGGNVTPAPSENEIYKDVTDLDRHLVSQDKLLHRVTLNESNRVFVQNGVSDYVIVLGTESSAARKAATFLSNQIGAATGAYLPVVTNATTWDSAKKYLAISCDGLAESAGITWANETENIDLGYSGYMIKSAGNSVFMEVNSDYGYQMVVLSFLREVLGYEWFGDDTVSFSKTGATLPDMDIVEKPDFDLTFSSSSWLSASKYASGLTDIDVFVSPEGEFVHNTYTYLPPETYFEEHPEWYSDKWGTYHDGYRPGQLCYTAHGDKTEYELMQETAVESMMKYLNENKQSCTITFTQQDTQAVCDCEYCSASTSAFNSISATLVMFVNDLEDKLRAALTEQAESEGTAVRDITVLFFAYQKTSNAPVSGESSADYALAVNPDNELTVSDGAGGTKVLTLPYNKTYASGIVCNEKVGCFYAPIGARYNKSLYADTVSNTGARIELEKWGMVADTLYIWTYDTNFYNYLFPYNSYDSIVETARALKANNADFYFAQSQDWRNGVHPAFGALKRYIVASVRYNVNMNYEDAVDRFFENYFQDAAAPMRKYYNKLIVYLDYLEGAYPSAFTGSIYDSFVNESTYWSFGLMNDYLTLCDEAYSAIEKYKTSNPEKYDLLKKHIDIETLFPRFVICENYGGMYSNSEIQAMRQAFCTDCKNLGLNKYAENDKSVMTDYFDKWGVD